MEEPRFKLDQRVAKLAGDYRYEGVIVVVFRKLTGQWRYVVEDDRGLLFIFSDPQLTLVVK